ncbi:MAG: ATP-binding cassette domain-containing protein [Cyanobacteria bacterium J06626_23]
MLSLALPRLRSDRQSTPLHLPSDVRLKADRVFKGVMRQGEAGVSVIQDLTLTLRAGDCVGLTGPSILAKSILLQVLHGQSSIDAGALWLVNDDRWVNLAQLSRSQLQAICHHSIGYLGQVLPLNPRITAFETVLEPLMERKISRRQARETATRLLSLLNIPTRLWRVSPTQFSKAEQQRINIARTFAVDYPVYLLNMPMTGLAGCDRTPLLELIRQRKASGSAFVGIFQDPILQTQACTHTLSC